MLISKKPKYQELVTFRKDKGRSFLVHDISGQNDWGDTKERAQSERGNESDEHRNGKEVMGRRGN